MLKKIFKVSNLKYLVAFLLPLVVVFSQRGWLDNDTWFVLAEGRYITENGVYYTDVLSMHYGLEITVQQYGGAVLFWLLYSFLGPAGLYIFIIILNFIICFLIYKISMLISNKNVNLSLAAVFFVDVFMAFVFIVTRVQMISYIMMLLTIYILELYIRHKNKKILCLLPILSFVQINMHASLWPMLLIIMGVYIVDSLKIPMLHLEGYKTMPLVITLLISILVGFLNPYGIRMMTFIFTSYGVDVIFSFISEMQTFDVRSLFNIAVYLAVVFTLIALIFGKKENIKVRYLIMFFGFFALSINSIKGLSELFLTMFLPLVLVFKDFRIKSKIMRKMARVSIVWLAVLAVGAVSVCCGLLLPSLKDYPDAASKEAVDAIDQDIEKEKRSKEGVKVYTGYNDGGYLEFRGYRPYLDPRAEVFLKNNNGKEDILQEWLDYRRRIIPKDDFLAKYNFDYLFVWSQSEPMYTMNDQYERIYDNEEQELRVYKRIEQNE